MNRFDPAWVEERHRRWPLLRHYDVDLHLHPYLTVTPAPGSRTPVYSVDDSGFRRSASALGEIDSLTWPRHGGGLVLGASTVFGTGASGDSATLPSRLAFLLDRPQLNLGVFGGNSLHQLIAAAPFLHSARTVVVLGGWVNLFSALRTRWPGSVFAPVLFENPFHDLARHSLFDLVDHEVLPGSGEPPGPRPVHDHEASRARLDHAVETSLRDLATLARAAGDARVLFCLQPLCDPRTRDLVPRERELFDFHRPMREATRDAGDDFLVENWAGYGKRLEAGCAEIGVEFADLAADGFTGWSFYDATHLTDDGYRQAAERIAAHF